MLIIGITGTLGAGKGTIVEYLAGELGFVHYSVRAWLLEEIRRRGLPGNRDSMFKLANDLRAANGPSYVTDQLFNQARESGKNCIIESIRTPGEITSLRQKGPFVLFAVDADPRIRYERILKRQSETDRISFETFLANEARETGTTDPNKQNLSACMKQADYLFLNNSTRAELFTAVSSALSEINGK